MRIAATHCSDMILAASFTWFISDRNFALNVNFTWIISDNNVSDSFPDVILASSTTNGDF